MKHSAIRVAFVVLIVLLAVSAYAQTPPWQSGSGTNAGNLMVDGGVGISAWPQGYPFRVQRDGFTLSSATYAVPNSGGSLFLSGGFLSATASGTPGVFLGYDTSGTIGAVGSLGQSSSFTIWTGTGSGYAERLRINTSGDIGIGTASPSGIFHVQRDQNAMTSSFVRNYNTGVSAPAAAARFVAQTEGVAMTMEALSSTYTNAGARQANAGALISSGAGGMSLGTTTTAAGGGGIRFYTGGLGNQRMSINLGGNVAIGAYDARNLLDVAGPGARALFDDKTANAMLRIMPLDPAYVVIDARNSNQDAALNLSLQPSGGNVGIGLLVPAARLDVNGDLKVAGPINAGTATVTAGALISATSGGLSAGSSAGDVRLYAGNLSGERLHITAASGNVGIGTSLPNASLHVSAQGGRTLVEDTISGTMLRIIPASSQYAALDAYNSAQNQTRHLLLQPNGGWVGINTGSALPTAALDVQGDINVSGNINAKYQDVAEWVETTEPLGAGTVVVLSQLRNNVVTASTQAYDTAVAGVVSAQPGITLGESGSDKAKIATTGRVKVHVDASRGAIAIGDLLVTSGVRGTAMKSEMVDIGGLKIHRPGTIVGKALEPLASGEGDILVLLTLQ